MKCFCSQGIEKIRKYYQDKGGWCQTNEARIWPVGDNLIYMQQNQQHNCNECKHRLACLVDPGYNRTFENI